MNCYHVFLTSPVISIFHFRCLKIRLVSFNISWFLTHLFCVVLVPDRALVLDWVFADGPPKNARVYDNNSNQDFHAIVPNCISEEIFWADEEQCIYDKIQEERKFKVEAAKRKVSLGVTILAYLL